MSEAELEACLRRKILFLCETNGVHSPIAEALLSRIDSEHFEAISAGASPGRLHPLTVEVVKEVGIDLSRKIPKHIRAVADDSFDYVITFDEVSARAYRNPRRIEVIHWKLDDPLATPGDPESQLRAFRMVRDQIAQRLRLFVIVNVRRQVQSTPGNASMAARAK